MQPTDTEDRVLAVMAAALKCPVGPDTRRDATPSWDSLTHLELVFALEEELGLEFSQDELEQLDSAAAIVAISAGRACSMAT